VKYFLISGILAAFRATAFSLIFAEPRPFFFFFLVFIDFFKSCFGEGFSFFFN